MRYYEAKAGANAAGRRAVAGVHQCRQREGRPPIPRQRDIKRGRLVGMNGAARDLARSAEGLTKAAVAPNEVAKICPNKPRW